MIARHAFQYPRFVPADIARIVAGAAETASIRMLCR
jgi:hypothetical protein